MIRATLRRFLFTDTGTYGLLSVGKKQWALLERSKTGENPCIPAGLYIMKLGMFWGGDGPGGKKDYAAYEVQNVPNRKYIKVHIANEVKQLLGCLAPGLAFWPFDGILGIRDSTPAFHEFMFALQGATEVELQILEG